MYEHHKESIEKMIEYFRKMKVEALMLIGSVAKGTERYDSDLDCVVVLSDKVYEEKVRENVTSDTIDGMCTYEGGYFDVKYVSKDYLIELAEKGSEPARNTYNKAKILFSNIDDLQEIIDRIPVFQKSEKEEKMLSFYSDFWLNYYYFLKCCSLEGFMKMRTISEIIYAVYRMILQENEILFDCNRRVERQVERISTQTRGLVQIARELEKSQSIEDVDKFIDCFFGITSYVPPENLAEVFSTYARDFQEWWREYRPNISEW